MTTTTTLPTKQPLGPNQEAWLRALESGRYKQGTNYLRSIHDEFCCLGVGCVLAKIPVSQKGGMYAYDEAHTALAPVALKNWLGLFSDTGIAASREESLAGLNDSGKTFAEIAAIVRQDPAMYFSQPK